MVDFKLAPVKPYAKLANNKALQQFISVTKDVLKQALAYVTPFLVQKCKTGCCCFTQNKFKRKGMFKTVRSSR